MIELIETHCFGIIPEETISNNLIEFIEENFKLHQNFTIRTVPINTNPAHIANPLIGFYSPYGIAYISNPEKKHGIIAIDFENKTLVYNSNESAFHSARDNVVYIQSPYQYIRESYQQVLEEFQTQDYSFYEYLQKESWDYICRLKSPRELILGKSLTLEELL